MQAEERRLTDLIRITYRRLYVCELPHGMEYSGLELRVHGISGEKPKVLHYELIRPNEIQ